jgi:hypothetical protein
MRSRVAILLFLFFTITRCYSQTIKSHFNTDAQVIRDVLLDNHVSGSLVFSGGCKFQDRKAQVPTIGTPRSLSSPMESLRDMLSVNSGFQVTQDSDGLIRMVETKVPTDLLKVQIHRISFSAPEPENDGGPDSLALHGPWIAMEEILRAPEVTTFMKVHRIEFPNRDLLPGNVSSPSLGDATGELHDVTLSQALDFLLKTFPGYWVYEDASCEDGSRTVRLNIFTGAPHSNKTASSSR